MSNQIKAIEANIKAARKLADLGDALERLKSNKDFRTVILEGYFEKEAIRLVQAKSNPAYQSPEMQQSIITQIDAIGNLNMFFTTLLQQADMARKTIAQDEAEIEELAAEEA
jgi:TolA-binding protein